MSRRHIFDPIAEAHRFRYIATDPLEFSLQNTPISRGFRYYETLGDKSTAHTPDMPLPIQLLPDYLYSLAAAIQTNPEIIDTIGYDLRCPVDEQDMEFAEGIGYNSEKVRYFNLKERKVSSTPSKRFDKRWEEIKSYMDGTPLGMFHVLVKDHYSGIQKFVLMYEILDYLRRRHSAMYGQYAAQMLKWDGVSYSELDNAYATVRYALRANEAAHAVQRLVKRYRESLEEKTEVTA